MSSSDRTSLGDRMKAYECAARTTLPGRLPVIIRVDGKAFHTYTKACEKPFDSRLVAAMNQVAIDLCKHVQGAQIAYVQSDEVSVLVHGYKTFESQPWFDNQVQKMVSVSAAVASATMTAQSQSIFGELKPAYFDSRVFVLPEADVRNYFLWRQQDTIRNSKQMLARSLFSHKECDKKNGTQLEEMCLAKGQPWGDLDAWKRHGRCVSRKTYEQNGVVRSRWEVDLDTPLFSQDPNYINQHLVLNEEG
jgi:tRNA(His) guanylyltransferase